MASDWVKAHRSMMDSAVWADEWLVKLWMWCLFKAQYRDSEWNGRPVLRGQFVTGRIRASEELDVSPGKWLRGIEKLVAYGCITTKSDSVCTIVNVCNYSTYQADSREGGTADSTANDTGDSTSNGTSSSTPNGTPTGTSNGTHKKKDKKDKNINTFALLTGDGSDDSDDVQWQASPTPKKCPLSYSQDFENFWSNYPPRRRTAKKKAYAAWQRALKSVDPITIIEAAREYGESAVGRGEYVKSPEAWLNGACWDDDRAAWDGKPKCRVPSAESLANWTPYN